MLDKPKIVISKAWMANQEDGSSTLVVVTLPYKGNTIYTAYVGDSGYCLLRPQGRDRDYKLVFESSAQQRRFNFPYQLGWGKNGDQPNIAVELSHEVANGDIIILGTDGLFDNIVPKNVCLK